MTGRERTLDPKRIALADSLPVAEAGGKLPPPPADVDVGKLRRNGWCREVDGGWVVTDSAAWALRQGEEQP